MAEQKANYEAGGKFKSYVTMAKDLTAWRNARETLWLKQGFSQSQQSALKDLENAYKRFFKKEACFPQFKKKGQKESFRFPDSKTFKIDGANARISFPKIGWVRYRASRGILGTPKNMTVSCKNGKWFVSIQTEREVDLPAPPKGAAVGVDLGIVKFAALSNGQFLEGPNALRQARKRLTFAQRALSRKTKFSNNWKRQKWKVSRIHARVAQIRLDSLHKHSHYLSKNHALVVVEGLKVANMSKSARGSVAAPGVNVKAKSGLNRSILDQGWGEWRRQLEYKVNWRGGLFLKVPPRNTSRTCPQCDHCEPENRAEQAVFQCLACGHLGNADTIASQNILRAGLARLACGEELRPGNFGLRASSKKQEPTEGMKRFA